MTRKFFCLSAGLAVCSFGFAGEKPEIQRAMNGTFVQPLQIAGVDASGKRITPWYDYNQGTAGTGSNCSNTLVFDSFWPDPVTKAPVGGELCRPTFSPSTRWYFGATYHNPLNAFKAGFNGASGDVDRYQLAWWWNLTDTCLILTQFTETPANVKNCLTDPLSGAFLGGIILNFGTLAAGAGYYYTDVDLCDNALSIPLPAGQFAMVTTVFAQSQGTGGTLFLSPGPCQNMLWGIVDGVGGTGEYNEFAWDDDNVTDGTFTLPDECYTGFFGLCPDPLNKMYAFYSPQGPSDCVTLTVPTLFGGSPATFSTSGAAGQLRAILYAFNSGAPISGQQGNFCAETELRPATGAGQVCTGTANGAGNQSCTRPIPNAAIGRTIHFQAFGAGTCPDPCDSNLETRTIQ